jgi:N-acetylmuramoyl-L-alanine amidase
MRRTLIMFAVLAAGAVIAAGAFATTARWDAAEADGVELGASEEGLPLDERELRPRERPPGPPRVGVQIGHWKRWDMPDELAEIRERGGGTRWNGNEEWEVCLAIGEALKAKLETEGIIVDLLPATVPPSYAADAFLSLHADGNDNQAANGYKIAGPWRDPSGKSWLLVEELDRSYGAASGLRKDTNVTHAMRGYYAFNWRRHTHAIHPLTPAALVEFGFLTSPKDREILMGRPDVAAEAIVQGLLRFLEATVPDWAPAPADGLEI